TMRKVPGRSGRAGAAAVFVARSRQGPRNEYRDRTIASAARRTTRMAVLRILPLLLACTHQIVAPSRVPRQEEIHDPVAARQVVLEDRARGEPPLQGERGVFELQLVDTRRDLDEQAARVERQVRRTGRQPCPRVARR